MTPACQSLLLLAGTGRPTSSSPPGLGQGLFQLFPFIAIIVVFFWMMNRSQKKRQRARQEMLDGIRAKDDVVTIGGIHGRVVQVRDDTVVLRIDSEKDVKITIARTGVSRKADEPEEPA